MDNSTIELIEKRRSIRAFEERPIEPEVLDRLRRLTLRAPTGGNMVMWSVVEVTDKEKKDRLAYICDKQSMISRAPGVWVFLADMQRWTEFMEYSGSDKKSGIAMRKPGIGDFHLAMQDAVIAAQNAVIAIEALGMSSCYIGDVIENYEMLRELLDLPKYACPAAMVIFGYKKYERRDRMTTRPEPEFIFMENGYRHQDLEGYERTYKALHDELEERKILPYDNTGTVADYYYNRKYSSDFMKEMNRSASVFISRWCDENAE